MADSLPICSFQQDQPLFVDPSTRTRPHPYGQGNQSASDLSDFYNSHVTHTLDLNNLHRPRTLSLNPEPSPHLSRIENISYSNLSDPSVSQASVTTDLIVPAYNIPYPTEYNDADPHESVSNTTLSDNFIFPEDILQQQLEAEAYANLPRAQGTASGRGFLADPTPVSGLDHQGTGNLIDLASGAPSFIVENVHYTANPQSSSSISSVHDPNSPKTLPPSYVSTTRYFSPYINPYNLEPSRISDFSYLLGLYSPAPRMTNSNSFGPPNISAPHLYLGPDMGNPEGLKPSDRFNPSHIFNVRRRLAPKVANTNGLGPSDIFNPIPFAAQISEPNIVEPSFISRRRRRAPQLSNPSSFDPSGICDPSRLVENMTNLKSAKPSGGLIPRPVILETTNPNGLEPAYISNKDHFDMDDMAIYFTNPNGNLSDALEPPAGEYSTPQPVRDAGPEVPQPRKKGPRRKKSDVLLAGPEFPQKRKRTKKPASNGLGETPSSDAKEPHDCTNSSCKASKDNDVPKEDAIDVFDMFTHINETPEPDSVNDGQVPDTSEPQARHCHTCQPTKDADSEKVQQPRRRYRKRQKSNVLPTGLDPGQKKRRTKETKPNGFRKHQSTDKRRTNPAVLYFCLHPSCIGSQDPNFLRIFFSSRSDLGRHWRSHETKKFVCTLPHTDGKDHFVSRSDYLYDHIRKLHSDIKDDDPELVAVRSQKHKLPELKEGVHYTSVRTR